MEMCHRENLYQIDLLNGSKNRITDKEYHAQLHGQLELDKQNAEAVAAGMPVMKTKFETDKDRLRVEIRAVLSEATSFEDFVQKLLQREITVKESRGFVTCLRSAVNILLTRMRRNMGKYKYCHYIPHCRRSV